TKTSTQKKTEQAHHDDGNKDNSTAAVPKATMTKTIDPPTKKKETAVSPDETALIQKKDVEVDPTTGERKSVTRNNDDVTTVENNTRNNTERTTKKTSSEPKFLDSDVDPKNLLRLVSVKSNEYERGAFGGIRGLELTVYNNSNFLLDQVSVEVNIMKPSEQPLRTDVITFKNIAANGSVTVKVPDSQRGIRVDYHITTIESKQFQKSTAGL
ncbi:MAG TPA: hypothetical protein VGI82_06645, partial [Chitinophagaceae bacterium]